MTGKSAKFWRPLSEVIIYASNYPDYFAAGELQATKSDRIDHEWREYAMLPVSGNRNCHAVFKPLDIRNTYPEIIDHWLDAVFKNMSSGNKVKAAKFTGCLSHIIGDTGQAAHVFDERLIKQLLPQKDKCFIFHPAIEKISGKIPVEKYAPRQLASGLDELKWRLIEELEILKQRSTAEVIPIITAIMEDDHAAAQASASRTLTLCAKLFADLLFSIRHIIAEPDAKIPNVIDLRELVPLKQSCDMLFNYGIMIDRVPGKTIDQPLKLNLGDGDVPGIALLPNMAPNIVGGREAFVEYRIPRNTFQYFETETGLNRGSVNETEAIFMVMLDDNIAHVSDPLDINEPANKIKIELGNAQTLKLYVRDARPAPFDTKFFYPVFANPRLSGRIH